MKATKQEIIERLKAQHYDEDLPWTFSAYKMSDMLYGLWYDFYLESLNTQAGEWEWTLRIDFFEPTVNAVILTDEQEREYNFETLEEIAEQILRREWLYERYKAKFLPLKELQKWAK